MGYDVRDRFYGRVGKDWLKQERIEKERVWQDMVGTCRLGFGRKEKVG